MGVFATTRVCVTAQIKLTITSELVCVPGLTLVSTAGRSIALHPNPMVHSHGMECTVNRSAMEMASVTMTLGAAIATMDMGA